MAKAIINFNIGNRSLSVDVPDGNIVFDDGYAKYYINGREYAVSEDVITSIEVIEN